MGEEVLGSSKRMKGQKLLLLGYTPTVWLHSSRGYVCMPHAAMLCKSLSANSGTRHRRDRIMQSCTAQKQNLMTSAICTSHLLAVGGRVSSDLERIVLICWQCIFLVEQKRMAQRGTWSAVQCSAACLQLTPKNPLF